MRVFLSADAALPRHELQALSLKPLRRRGPRPRLAGSEVIAIELAGESLGLDRDSALFGHFRRHHGDAFPGLREVGRTTSVRQAANLWAVKRRLAHRLAERLTAGDRVWLADSLPVPVCRFARAKFSRQFGGQAAFGKDHLIRQAFHGFRLHVRASREGVIESVRPAAADLSEVVVLFDLEPPPGGVGIGDRDYWSPQTQAELAGGGVTLPAPCKSASKDPDPRRSRRLNRVRRMIETVFSRLTGRLQVKRVRARDLWHLCHRIIRKVLCHTVAAFLNVSLGRRPLDFDALLAA